MGLAAPRVAPRRVALAPSGATLGRPALNGEGLLFHVAGATSSRIDQVALATGARTTLRSKRRTLFLNPSAYGNKLLYVRSTYERQQLRIGALRKQSVKQGPRAVRHGPHRAPRRGLRAGRGAPCATATPGSSRRARSAASHITLWSTALAADAAYVTRLRQDPGKPMKATLLRIAR